MNESFLNIFASIFSTAPFLLQLKGKVRYGYSKILNWTCKLRTFSYKKSYFKQLLDAQFKRSLVIKVIRRINLKTKILQQQPYGDSIWGKKKNIFITSEPDTLFRYHIFRRRKK